VSHDDGVDYRVLFEGELVLIELADTLVRRGGDIARRRYQAAVENLHKRRLAAAIRAD
jgi:hypothetical protein